MTKPEERRAEGLGPAAILLILVLGAAVSVLAWQYVGERRNRQLERQAQTYASTLTEVIDSTFDELHETVRKHARLWGNPEFDARPGAWRESADLFLSEHPAVLAILRADSSWEIAGTREGEQSLREAVPELRRRQADPDGDFVAGPVVVASGQRVIGIQVRMQRDAGDARVLFALFDPRLALQQILDQRALGYSLVVSADGEEIYRRETQAGGELAGVAVTQPLSARAGLNWSLTLRPTADVLGPLDTSPRLALLDGLLASALVAAAVHFGTLAWRRQSALQRANAALAQQVDDTRRGRIEVEELSRVLEARVVERTEELDETIVELETFNYSVSHDLRGPLGAVINFAAILEEDYGSQLDATGKEHLRRIATSASAAVAMMDALLAFSRSGRTELRKAHLHVRALVQEVVGEISSGADTNPAAVRIGDLPDATADETMLRFIFSNLISNAFKFARKGEAPQVEIGGSFAASEVVYFVRDSGIGFDMRFADKLFKVFERLHTADHYEGNGIGLAIVARMVRRHGGRVWAQGALEKGATFYFSVPTQELGNHARSPS